MLVSEPMGMLHWQTLPTRPHILSGINADILPRWADEVAQAGGLMLGQVQDNGRGFRAGHRNLEARGASALPDDLSWTVPQVLDTDGVLRMIDEFVRSCEMLAKSGFAGVEISAGHGHLFHQFLAARSNHREDMFGGDLEGRARLLVLLMQGIRDRCGTDFIIGAKLPAVEGVDGGIDLDDAARITAHLHANAPMDYLTYCWGSQSDSLYTHLPDVHGPRTPYVDAIRALGQSAPGTPLGALGLITDPNEAERIVRDGLGDLVMIARAMITDPAWGIKAEQGREAQIRYCVSCNTCWHMITTGRGLRCDNNPRVGAIDEADWTPPLAERSRRVVIVGAGIAGMEAAWVAAARGHAVTVFGASDMVGGKTRLHAILPGGEGVSSIYDYQELAAGRHGVTMRLNETATVESILALQPDVVILATGATPSWPDFLPVEYRDEGIIPDLRAAIALLEGYPGKQPGTAVIYDEDHGASTYDAVEYLMERFDKVAILTPRDRIASDESLMVRQGVYKRLYGKDALILTSVRPLGSSRLEEGELAYANIYNGNEAVLRDVALFTYATPRVPQTQLLAPLKAAGVELLSVGDCKAPRNILSATEEGYRAAMEI